MTKNQLLDVLERALSTFVQSVVALLASSASGVPEVDKLSVATVLYVSAGVALLSVVKGTAAAKLPFGDASASLLRVGYERIRRVVERVEVPVPAPAPTKKSAVKKAAVKKSAPKK